MLKLFQLQEQAPIHSEAAQWLHPEGFLLTQKKSSIEYKGSVFLQNFMNHSPRNMVSHPRRLILIYPVGTPHIISKDFTSQQPSLAFSRQFLFLVPNQAVAALHHSTTHSCLYSTHYTASFTEPNNELHQRKRRKCGTCHGDRLGDLL